MFSPIPPPDNNNEVSNRAKGTQDGNGDQGQDFAQKATPTDEVEEFLRIIRKSDYKVVDQLNQTPSKI